MSEDKSEVVSTNKEETETEDKPKKATKKQKEALKLQELEARIEKLEKNQKVIIDGYEFVANETRPLYGMGAVALIFDAIYAKLKK